jgi:hypothetical protein
MLPVSRRSRALLAASLCGVAALSLAPQIWGATAAGNDDMVTAGWVGLLFLTVAAGCAVLRRRIAAGIIILITIAGTHYFAMQHPPYFDLQEIIWGLTPPLLLALWHLANAHQATRPSTWAVSALWVMGFAVKVLQVRGWRV